MQFKTSPSAARKLLVKALRSGEYRQGMQSLCKVGPEGYRYCCLGVACMVFHDHAHPIRIEMNNQWLEFDGEVGRPTSEIANFFGFQSRHLDHLINLNDTLRQDFQQIADYIEAEFTGQPLHRRACSWLRSRFGA